MMKTHEEAKDEALHTAEINRSVCQKFVDAQRPAGAPKLYVPSNKKFFLRLAGFRGGDLK